MINREEQPARTREGSFDPTCAARRETDRKMIEAVQLFAYGGVA